MGILRLGKPNSKIAEEIVRRRSAAIKTKIYRIGGGAPEEKSIIGELTWQSIGKSSQWSSDATIQKIEIGSEVTSVAPAACYSCSKMLDVDFRNSKVATIGSNAFAGCSVLSSVAFSNTIQDIGAKALMYCLNLKQISCYATAAPTVQANTFGDSASTYTGYNTHSAGTNKLYVPEGATGYNASYWADPLQNTEKCGYSISKGV